MARASIGTSLGIIVGMALGVASAEASALQMAGAAVLLGQQRPRNPEVVYNSGVEAYRRGEYEQAALLFQEAQKRQEYLSAASRQDLQKYIDLNNTALKGQRAGAEQVRQAEAALKAGKTADGQALIKAALANQYLSTADKTKALQLSGTGRPATGPVIPVASPPGVSPEDIARKRLKQGRDALARGQFEVAEGFANDALKLKAAYNANEDRPDLLLKEIERRKTDGAWLLRTGRECLTRGEFDQAEKLANLSEKSWGMHMPFGDNPRKLLGDIQVAKKSQKPATPVANQTKPVAPKANVPTAPVPNSPQNAQGPDGNQSRTNPGAQPPMTTGAKSTTTSQVALNVNASPAGAAAPATTDANNDKAHRLLRDARAAVQAGELTKAQQILTEISTLHATFNWWENDTPEKIMADIQRASANVKATQAPLAPAAGAKKPAPVKEPDARELTRIAREELNAGKIEEADKTACQAKAKANRITWGLFDDSPDKVLADVRKARNKHDRDESVRMLAEGRKLFNEGKYAEAKEKAYRADRLHGAYGMWDMGDRPQKLLADIHAAEVKTQQVKLPPAPPPPARPDAATKKIETIQTASAAKNTPATPAVQGPSLGVAVAAGAAAPQPATPAAAPVVAPVPQVTVVQNNPPAQPAAPWVIPPSSPPAQPAVQTSAAPSAPDLTKQWALQCLMDARRFQAEGKLVEARQKAEEGVRLRANFAPNEDSPELALSQLNGLAAKRIDQLEQEATDLTNTAGNDAQRVARAEQDLLAARQLATGFGRQTQSIDAKLSWVRQTRERTQTVSSQPTPGALPVTTAQRQESPLAAANSPQQHGLELLEKAKLELRYGNTANARRLATEVYQGPYGMQPQAVTVLRSIDVEELNQRRLVARHAFEAGQKEYLARNFSQAAGILRSVDFALLDPKDQARYKEIMRMPEMQPQQLVQTRHSTPELPVPAPALGSQGTAPGVATASDQFPPPAATPEPSFAQRTAALHEIQFQKLREQGLQAQRDAMDRFRAGETDRALEILNAYLTSLSNTDLGDGRAASLKRPVEVRLEQFKQLKASQDLANLQIDKKQSFNQIMEQRNRAEQLKQEKVAELMKEYRILVREGKPEEARLTAMKAKELDPENPVVDAAIYMSELGGNKAKADELKKKRENMFIGGLNDAEDEGPFVGNENPLKLDSKIHDRSKAREPWNKGFEIRAPRTEKELEIERSLLKLITVNFKNLPLQDVIVELKNLSSVNIVPDLAGLEEQGIKLDRPITISLENVSLKSALNLLLEQVHLTYVVRDEVLKITTKEKARGSLVQRTLPVADLVIPVDNFSMPAGLDSNAMFEKIFRNSNNGPSAQNNMYMSPTGLQNGTVASNSNSNGSRPTGNQMTTTTAPRKTFGPGSTTEDILIQTIMNTVAPQSWSSVGGPGTIDYFPLGMALVINQTPDIQEQIVELLHSLRRLQDIEVSVEVRIINLTESFYERIGVDFNVNIVNRSNQNYASQLIANSFGPSSGLQSFAPSNATIGLTPAGTFTHDLNIPITVSSFGPAVPPFNAVAPGADGGISMGLAFLSDIQVFMLLDAAQGDKRTNVMQAPKLTMFNGQSATINITDTNYFVTGTTVGITPLGVGSPTYSPNNSPFPTGVILTMQPVVSADRRFVRINLNPTLSTVSTLVPLFPYSTVITPVYDVSPFNFAAAPQPIVITQYLQQPKFNTITVQTTVNIPDGGTVLLGGMKTMREGRNEFGPPVLSKIPYISRLFKNTAYDRDTESIMIMVTPRIIINEEEETIQTGYVPPPVSTGF